ncbi:hypothetical protein MMC14_009066 [Varicellaria rhodocarpa]|nr:hypothetical protein [Varicellaria rhodocarpa]
MNPIGIVGPAGSDMAWCSSELGDGLRTVDCSTAARELPAVDSPTSYSMGLINSHPNWNRSTYDLPYRVSHGQCEMWIEIVGGGENINYHNQQISLIPSRIRGLAAFVIDRCVGTQSMGGYVTDGLEGMVEYIEQLPSDVDDITHFPTNAQPFPPSARFITVTVSGLRKGPPDTPNKDDDIPNHLSDELNSWSSQGDNPTGHSMFLVGIQRRAFRLMGAKLLMLEGRISNWWDGEPADPSLVIYECDSKLGNPTKSDCTQLEYSQLGPPSDTLAVGPEVAKLLSSNTCHVAISSSIPVMLTWDQVKIALQGLVLTCIENPMYPSRGGRAFYKNQGTPLQSKRTGQWRKRGTATVFDALPPHVNLTISGG